MFIKNKLIELLSDTYNTIFIPEKIFIKSIFLRPFLFNYANY